MDQDFTCQIPVDSNIFIDTGDAKKDIELGKWLKEVLTKDAKDAGIRIFSIAFSEDADFELIQTIAVKTGGGYYRAIRKEDLQNVFSNIQQVILRPQQRTEQKVDEVGFSRGLLVVAVIGLIVLGIIAIIVISKREKKSPEVLLGKEEAISTTIPTALLEDVGKITGKEEHNISKKETAIGRGDDKGSSVDIAIPQNTVSGLHATIEYKDNNFYVIDQRSTNKTYLNNQTIPPGVPQRLKSGDMIAFDRFKFKFVIQEQVGKGGTILRPAVAGGTILRPQAPPEIKPQQPVQEAVSPNVVAAEEDPAGRTVVKPEFCEIHPSFKASELCPVCKKGYCGDCMVEKDGRRICSRCAQKQLS